MSDAAFVDGAAEPIRTADGRTWLFPAVTAGVWFFARRLSVSGGPDGPPVLALLRKRRHPACGPAVTDGGAFSVQAGLVASAPDAAEERAWTEAVGAGPGERPVFAPLALRAGRMTVEVAGRGPAGEPDPLGGAVTAVADLTLDAAEADAFAAALGSGSGPPVTLCFEHRYDVAVRAGDDLTVGVAELRRSIDLAEMRGLDPAAHVADVTGDETVPLTITCPPDPRVHRYAVQYGYVRPDGTTGGGSAHGDGADGLRLRHLMRWDPGGGPPSTVEVRHVVEWAEPDWPASTGTTVLATGPPCLSWRSRPSSIAEVALRTDLGREGPGSFATISWRAGPVRPDRPQLSGTLLIEGTDGLLREVIAFPAAPLAIFTWTAELVHPDGTTAAGQGGFVVRERNEADVLRASLKPGPALG
ncbi:hypothetical protein Ade02nite_47050 [Paractinoplanes deccanensis]|uniref:Uncharacterized protein n=1 Tax=Paractinoplanes deccanensis TaxID=113561 RepID=A0ABQ3Y7U7_9ACTN|nr:hypothetical protein [Actinoplanes deccanensis]GID76064.1 hypothetical protein Ade02nite_47050 [Actinoplanes deccanensis]